MEPRARLDECGTTRPTGIRSSDRPASSRSQYRLSYHCSSFFVMVVVIVVAERMKMMMVVMMTVMATEGRTRKSPAG